VSLPFRAAITFGHPFLYLIPASILCIQTASDAMEVVHRRLLLKFEVFVLFGFS
jgi:hypothetical protein